VLFFLGVMLIATLVTFLMPNVYRSEAKLMVRLGRENVTLDPTATTAGQVVSTSALRENEMKSELAVVKSRDLAERVVDSLGVSAFVKPSFFGLFGSRDPLKARSRAVEVVMNHLEATSEKDSNIITIAYEAKDPHFAQKVVQKFMEFYLEKHLAVNRTPGSHKFFKDQTEKIHAQLMQAEKELGDLKNKTGLSSITEQQKLLLERIGSLEKEYEQTNTDLKASKDKVVAMQALAKQIPASIVTEQTSRPNQANDLMRQKLYDLQLKEQELLSKYTEKNFLVKEIRRQIKNAKALLTSEKPRRTDVSTGINLTHQQLKSALVSEEANLAALQAKGQSLSQQIVSSKNELKTFNQNAVAVSEMERQVQIREANYRKYADKLEQARIDDALEMKKISNLTVAQAPTYPSKPVRPRKALNLALGFMLGGFGAIGLAFIAEYTNRSFNRPEDVEQRLKMPVLATIPLMQADGSSNELIIGNTPAQKSLPFLLPEKLPECGVVVEVGECYECLCDRLLDSEDPPRLLGMTSCRSGEGVSSVAYNMALCLARKSNERVLLVEANLKRPSARKTFSLRTNPGLTDFIPCEGIDFAAIKNSHTVNMDIIHAGHGAINLTRLAASKEFIELLQLWRNEYSFVVFDLPPIFKGPAALRLAGLMGAVIMVVGAEGVNSDVAERAKTQLLQAKVNLLGVVLNKRQFYIPEWLYQTL
jgi:capsular exopolysaccharide synthesis family protein